MTVRVSEIIVCDTCGKVIENAGSLESLYTAFTRPDLDYYHGIWMGDIGEHYVGSRANGEEKHFCDVHCLIGDILKFHRETRYKKEHVEDKS